MNRQIKILLREVSEVSWLLIKNLVIWVVKGIRYLYAHRTQIIQHKITLPALIVLSVAWTGFSSFIHENRETNGVYAQSEDMEEQELTAQVASAEENHKPVSSIEAGEDDSNDEEPFQNTRLVAHIMDWVGTPHRDNMKSKKGTDCSGFVQAVFKDTHGIELNRSSKAMYEEDVEKIHKSQLQEGDLVFFNTYGQEISHVGIYLKDGKFAHTTSSKGVTVNSLYDTYYQKNYWGAGRVKELINK